MEPRLLACLARWATGLHDARAADSFGYHRGLRPLLAMIIGLVVLEGGVVDALIAVLVPSGPWVWIALGLHLYALGWLVGFYASMVVRPHKLRPDGLHVRDGVFTELIVPYPAITGARPAHRTNVDRSGLKIDAASGVGLLAVGDVTVTLDLDPSQAIDTGGTPSTQLSGLDSTVNDPAGFLNRLHCAHQRSGEIRPHGNRSDRTIPTSSVRSSL